MAGVGTGIAGLTTSLNYYKSLSEDLTENLEETATSLITTQNQLDSLVVKDSQNRRGLELVTAENGGLCLVLEEASLLLRQQIRHCKRKVKVAQSHPTFCDLTDYMGPGILSHDIKWVTFPFQGVFPTKWTEHRSSTPLADSLPAHPPGCKGSSKKSDKEGLENTSIPQ